MIIYLEVPRSRFWLCRKRIGEWITVPMALLDDLSRTHARADATPPREIAPTEGGTEDER